MTSIDTINVPTTVAFLRQQVGEGAPRLAQSTLVHMRAMHDDHGITAWIEIVALLNRPAVA